MTTTCLFCGGGGATRHGACQKCIDDRWERMMTEIHAEDQSDEQVTLSDF